MKKTLGIIAIILGLGLIIYWQVDGGRIYGVDQVQVEVEKVDEIFGTVTKELTWKDEPHVGLLPVVGPLAGVLVLAGIVLLWMGRRSRTAAGATSS
jgi:hypothetical protein